MNAETITNIQINSHHFKLDVEQITGIELKRLAGIADANLLFREARGPGDDEQIQDGTLVQLHDGDRFYDMPQGNFGWR